MINGLSGSQIHNEAMLRLLAWLCPVLALKTRDQRGECKIFAMWDYHPSKVSSLLHGIYF